MVNKLYLLYVLTIALPIKFDRYVNVLYRTIVLARIMFFGFERKLNQVLKSKLIII